MTVDDPHQILKEVFRFLGVDEEIEIPDMSVKSEAGVPKSRLLMKIVTGNIAGMGVLKRILPIVFRRRVGIRIHSWNTRYHRAIATGRGEVR